MVVVLLSASGNTKRKKNKFSSENDVLEKSEVTLKFPTYALKMPPIITSRKRTNAKIDPVPGNPHPFPKKTFILTLAFQSAASPATSPAL